MIDLTTFADFLRRSSIGIVIGIFGLTAVIIIYMYRGGIKNAISPAKPAPATVAFGILPKYDQNLGFPARAGIAYTIQTVSGEFPNLPMTAKVFALFQNEPTFGGPGIVKQRAVQLGFPSEPLKVSENKMTFVDSRNSARKLTIDVLNGDLSLLTNYLANPSILSTRPVSVEEAKAVTRVFFKSAGLAFDRYPESKIQTQNFRVDGSNLVEANSLANTNVIQVVYGHGDLDKLPVIAAKKTENNVSTIIAKNDVVDAKIVNMDLLKNRFSTYPLKGAVKALEDLKAGRGNFNDKFGGDGLTITSVSIGYVEGDKEKGYLTPVYIFNTASGITAYVDAVDEAWVKN